MEDEPYGKFVEYDRAGKEWKKEGVYYRDNALISEEKFESFEENYTGADIDGMYLAKLEKEKQEVVPTPHLLENTAHLNNASIISGISNLTNQEAELEREKEKIMKALGKQFANSIKKKQAPKGEGKDLGALLMNRSLP